MENRILTVSCYGLHLYSVENLISFKKTQKIKAKKMLTYFQKNQEKYLKSIHSGVWLPIPSIPSINYNIKFTHLREAYSDDWEKVYEKNGFFVKVGESNNLWIEDIGVLDDDWTPDNYSENDNLSYKMLDGQIRYNSHRVQLSCGPYMVSVEGYCKGNSTPDYGFLFKFQRVETPFEICDPRQYKFKI